jgi:hypothetical protein
LYVSQEVNVKDQNGYEDDYFNEELIFRDGYIIE